MERWLESFARTNFLRSGDTAHDLKTPLNVAVLNLELLRMRIRKLISNSEDAKVQEYTSAIETELRRMAKIVDVFFLLSTPPRGDGAPVALDAAAMCAEAAADAGVNITAGEPAVVMAHESRIRQAFQLFFAAAANLFPSGTLQAAISRQTDRVVVTVTGAWPAGDFELSKVFKFYYTDPLGNPDLSMATARLIVETYGGELNAVEESDKVVIRLSLPPGEQ